MPPIVSLSARSCKPSSCSISGLTGPESRGASRGTLLPIPRTGLLPRSRPLGGAKTKSAAAFRADNRALRAGPPCSMKRPREPQAITPKALRLRRGSRLCWGTHLGACPRYWPQSLKLAVDWVRPRSDRARTRGARGLELIARHRSPRRPLELARETLRAVALEKRDERRLLDLPARSRGMSVQPPENVFPPAPLGSIKIRRGRQLSAGIRRRA